MNKKGFTLIELLVAISIIAALSVIGLTTYRGVTIKTRDSIRKNNLHQLATALELYFQKNGRYIITQNSNCNQTDINTFYSTIGPYVLDNAPKDPSGSSYCYYSENAGADFRLYAKLENCADLGIIKGINCSGAAWNFTSVSDNLTAKPAP